MLYCYQWSTPKTQNKGFGYGFIWILSGQLLRNNHSYQGDYFHKGFQPFDFGFDLTKIENSSLQHTADNLGYQKGMHNLLCYNGMVRANQNVPFSSVKGRPSACIYRASSQSGRSAAQGKPFLSSMSSHSIWITLDQDA